MSFKIASVPFFSKIISRQGVRPDLTKLKALTDMPPLKSKKEFEAFLGVLNYFAKFPISQLRYVSH